MKSILIGFAALGALAAAPAQAALLDFAGYAVGNEQGVANVAPGTSNLTLSGYHLRLTSSDSNTGAAYYSYLDDGSDVDGAGLGVCKALSYGECNPSNDDNVTSGEQVSIEFLDGPVNIDAMDFRQEGHIPFSGASLADTLLIAVNGGPALEYTFAAALATSFANVTSILFKYDDGANTADQFYLSSLTVSDVPLPAALPLLLSGIAGLGFAARKRKPV